MPPTIFLLLSTFSAVHLTEAYTGRKLGSAQVDRNGKVLGRGASISNLELAKIAEVRFRANENPELYYETKYSVKFLQAMDLAA